MLLEKDDQPKEGESEVTRTAAIESGHKGSVETTRSETTEDEKQDMDTEDEDFKNAEEMAMVSDIEDDIAIA